MPAPFVLAHFTRFGANVYAIGGDRNSAQLMGAPICRTMVQAYALGGFYGALAGVACAFHTGSGYPLAARGIEPDAIAAVVLRELCWRAASDTSRGHCSAALFRAQSTPW